MEPYIYKRNNEGIHIINLAKAWEKLMIAARVIAAIPNPKDVLVSASARESQVPNQGALLLALMGAAVGSLPLDRFEQRVRAKSYSEVRDLHQSQLPWRKMDPRYTD